MTKIREIEPMHPMTFAGLPVRLQHFYRQDNDPCQIRMNEILHTVCRYFRTSPQDATSTIKTAEVVKSRQIAIKFIKEHTTANLQQIGEFMGGRHHSTIIYSLATVQDLMDTDKRYKSTINKLATLI